MSGTDRDQARLRQRRFRLRARLATHGVEAIPDGWAIAPTRIAHLMDGGRPACGQSWVEDGPPLPAPPSLCRTCTARAAGEDWSEYA